MSGLQFLSIYSYVSTTVLCAKSLGWPVLYITSQEQKYQNSLKSCLTPYPNFNSKTYVTLELPVIQPCDLRVITTKNVDVECAAFELVNMRSGKNCLRLDLLDCEGILLCCSGGTNLVFFGLSGCRLTIQDSRHFSLSLPRCWMVAVEAFQIFMTA